MTIYKFLYIRYLHANKYKKLPLWMYSCIEVTFPIK